MGLRVLTFIVPRLKLKYLKLVFSETNSQHVLNWNKARTSWIKCKTDSQNETFLTLHFCKYNRANGRTPPCCHQWVILNLSPPPGTTGSISKLKFKKKKKNPKPKSEVIPWDRNWGTLCFFSFPSILFSPLCLTLIAFPWYNIDNCCMSLTQPTCTLCLPHANTMVNVGVPTEK